MVMGSAHSAVALNIKAASAAIQRDSYFALTRHSGQGRQRELDAVDPEAERAERGAAAADFLRVRRTPAAENEFRPVFRTQEADVAGPARVALSSYRSVAASSVGYASEGELVGIDLYV
jgi:hypothetical protein